MFRLFVFLLCVSSFSSGLFFSKTNYSSNCQCIPINYPCKERGFKIYFNFGKLPSSCLPGLFLCCDKGTWEKVHSEMDLPLDDLFPSDEKNSINDDDSSITKLLTTSPPDRLKHGVPISKNKHKTTISNGYLTNLMPSISTVLEKDGFVLHTEYQRSNTAKYNENGFLSINGNHNLNLSIENRNTNTVKMQINGEYSKPMQKYLGIYSNMLGPNVESSITYENELQSSGSSILNSDLMTSTTFQKKVSESISPMIFLNISSEVSSPSLGNVDELNTNLTWQNTYQLKVDNSSLNLQSIKFPSNGIVDSTSSTKETSVGITNNLNLISSSNDNLYNSDLNSFAKNDKVEHGSLPKENFTVQDDYKFDSNIAKGNEETKKKWVNKIEDINDDLGGLKFITIGQVNQNNSIFPVTTSLEEVDSKIAHIQADIKSTTPAREDFKMITIQEYIINTATINKNINAVNLRKNNEDTLSMNGNLKMATENNLKKNTIHEDPKISKDIDNINTRNDLEINIEKINTSTGISTTQFDIPVYSEYDNIVVPSLQDFIQIDTIHNENSNFNSSNGDILDDVTTTHVDYSTNKMNEDDKEANAVEVMNTIIERDSTVIVEIDATEESVVKINSIEDIIVELNPTEEHIVEIKVSEGDITENSTEVLVKLNPIERESVELNPTERENVDLNPTEGSIAEINPTEEHTVEIYLSEGNIAENSTEKVIVKLNPTERDVELNPAERESVELNPTEGSIVEINLTEESIFEFYPTEDVANLNSTEKSMIEINLNEGDIVELNPTKTDHVNLNPTEANIYINRTEGDVIQINSTEGEIVEFNSTEREASELNSTERDRVELNSTEGDVIEINPTKDDILEINTTEGDIIELKPTEESIVVINLIDGSALEINPTERYVAEINSTEDNIIEINLNKDVELNPTERNVELNPTERESVELNPTKRDGVELNPIEQESKGDILEINSTETDDVNLNPTETNINIDRTEGHVIQINFTEGKTVDLNSTEREIFELTPTERDNVELNSTERDIEINKTEEDTFEIITTEGDIMELKSTDESIIEINTFGGNILEINPTEVYVAEISSIEESIGEINSSEDVMKLNSTEEDIQLINSTEGDIEEIYSNKGDFDTYATKEDKIVTIFSDIEMTDTEKNIETSTNEDAIERNNRKNEITTTQDNKKMTFSERETETYTTTENIEMITKDIEIITNEDYFELTTTEREEIMETDIEVTSQNYDILEITHLEGHAQKSTLQQYEKELITAEVGDISTTVMSIDNIELSTEKGNSFNIDYGAVTSILNENQIPTVERIDISTTEYASNDGAMKNELEYDTTTATTVSEISLDKLTSTPYDGIGYTTTQVYSSYEMNIERELLKDEKENSETNRDQYLFQTENSGKITQPLFELNSETRVLSEHYNEFDQVLDEDNTEFSSTTTISYDNWTQSEMSPILDIENSENNMKSNKSALVENTASILGEFTDSTVTSNDMTDLESDTLKPIHINDQMIEESKRNTSKEEPVSEEPRREDNSVLGWIFNIFN